MKLLRMTATFGCLEHETLEFTDGFHLISAPNGSGKSTWCAFLRTMLYGLDTKQRDKKDAPADKNRYRPWSGSPMEGLLVCEHQGTVLEIRRISAGGVPMGEFSAVEAQTGQPIPGLTGENLGETLTGVSREVFDRSVFLRQTGLAVSQSQELEKRITSLVSSGEEDVSWSETDSLLKAWQHRRRFHKSGRIPQLEEREADIHAALDQTLDLRREISRLRSQAAELRRQKDRWDSRLTLESNKFQTINQRRYAEAASELDTAELRVQTAQAQLRELHDKTAAESEELYDNLAELEDTLAGRKRWIMGFFVFVILLTAAGTVVFYILPQFFQKNLFPLTVPSVILLGGAGLLWLLLILFALFRAFSDRRDRKEHGETEALLAKQQAELSARNKELQTALDQRNQAKRYFDAVSQQQGGPVLPPEADQCRDSLVQVENQMALLQGQLKALGDPVILEAELDNLQEESARLQEDYDALDVAMDALKEADDQLHARFSPQLSETASAYFSQLTGGRYTKVSLNRNLEVTVRDGEGLAEHPLFLLSQGTADQLYLALRLAVAKLVFPPESLCPLILDDALLSFDDARLSLALDCLLKLAESRQVLLFTCRDREARVLRNREGVSFLSLPHS